MFNTLKNLKNKYQNSNTWTDLFLALTGLDKQLANARTDKERVRILNQIVEAQQKQLKVLDEENEVLRNQLKDNEEVESIFSDSSNRSINSQRQKERIIILKKIETERGSTATNRKLLRFLDEIERLEQEKQELENKINNMNPLTQALKNLQNKLNDKLKEIIALDAKVKELQKELEEVKKERDELKIYKTDKENEEREALELIGQIDQSIDTTFAKIEVPSK